MKPLFLTLVLTPLLIHSTQLYAYADAQINDEIRTSDGRRFRVIKVLGRGQMGQVLHVQDIATRKEVAIKLYPGDEGNHIRKSLEVIQAVFNNPMGYSNVLNYSPMLDLQVIHDEQTIKTKGSISQLAHRQTLHDILPLFRITPNLLRQEKLDRIHLILIVTIKLMKGLASISGSGVIHRDIKPSNIFFLFPAAALGSEITAHDISSGLVQPMLGDPDMAVRVQDSSEPISLSGTPEFMSPEVFQGETLTPSGDLYSIAATIYQMYTGKTPIGNTIAHLPQLADLSPLQRISAINRSPDYINLVRNLAVETLKADTALFNEWESAELQVLIKIIKGSLDFSPKLRSSYFNRFEPGILTIDPESGAIEPGKELSLLACAQARPRREAKFSGVRH